MKIVYQQPSCSLVKIIGSAMMTTASMVFDSTNEIEDEKDILSREATPHFDIWEDDEEEKNI